MAIPNVSFTISNGNLGGQNSINDGIAGLILSHEATTELALNVPKAIYSIADAEALLITGFALEEITDFYTNAGEGQELWIMLISDTSMWDDVCDVTNDIAKKLLQESRGVIKIWGVNIDPPVSYVVATTKGIDDEIIAALPKAQALCEAMAAKFIPTRCILPGREFVKASVGDLEDLKTHTENRVQITLHGESASRKAKVGFLLGLYSAIAVQRNIGRVASGDLGLSEAVLSDGVTTAEAAVNIADAIHDKGYVLPIVRYGRAGYFYNDDPTATAGTDDYSSFARGRVIDKAQRIAYDVYLNFVNDDYAVDAAGQISPAELKRLQGSIDDAVNQLMVNTGELSAFKSYVDPSQDTLATGITKVKLAAQPRAYHKMIEVELGFTQTIE